MAGLDPISNIASGVSAVSGLVKDVIDRVLPDKDAAAKAKAEIDKLQLDETFQLNMKSGDIVEAEAKGESWLQRCWRPIVMLCFAFIVMNNYAAYPYLKGQGAVLLALPDQFWDLLKIGIGGYIGARSVEKITTTIAGTGASTKISDVVKNIFKSEAKQ